MKRSSTGVSPTITSTRRVASILRKNSESQLTTLFPRPSSLPMLTTFPRKKTRKRDLADPSVVTEEKVDVMVPEVVTVMAEKEEVSAVKVEKNKLKVQLKSQQFNLRVPQLPLNDYNKSNLVSF